MTTLATRAFEQYVAEQTASRGSVTFDEMIFANIPSLTSGNLVNHLQMPSNNQIVHRQTISQSGVVNENAVVYSVTMGTEVGNFDFNFIGLVNRSRNLLAVAVYTNTIRKIRNQNGVQGNSITRSILLQFTGARQLTNINVNAETWQIDFTARLKGLDEKIRLTNRDLYGRAIFFDDGFKVVRGSGHQYFVEVGQGYVEGVRVENKIRQTLTVRNIPCSIYVDTVHHNTVTGAYQTENVFLQAAKNDWIDGSNHQHYVQILADIDSNGLVTDRRLLDGRYIPNSKKSSSVTSNSRDTVATSEAVKTAYDKGVEAKNAADAAQRTANAKQSPATTLSGYGITDGVMVKGAQNIDLNQLFNQSAVWLVNGANKSTVGFSEKDIYNFGTGLTLASGPSASMLYMPHSRTKPRLYLKSFFNSHSPSPWAEVAMVDDVVRKTGDTMTGILEIDRADSFVRGKRNGVNKWYVGTPNGSTDDIALHNYTYNYGIVIKSDRVETIKPFYVGTNRVPHAGDSYMDLTSSNYGGITIQRPDRNDKMLMESHGDGFAFIRRNRTNNENLYVIYTPQKSGTLLLEGDLGAKTKALVSRRDYSRRINGTASGQTQNQMDVVGSVHIYPDGRIVQVLHLKHFRDLWFELEDVAVGYHDGGARGYQIPLQLWTAMPNKVLSVQPQLVRSTHPTSSVTYAGGEAGEHVCAWDLRKQGASRDRVTINMSRFRGNQSEHIDMYVVVEGY